MEELNRVLITTFRYIRFIVFDGDSDISYKRRVGADVVEGCREEVFRHIRAGVYCTGVKGGLPRPSDLVEPEGDLRDRVDRRGERFSSARTRGGGPAVRSPVPRQPDCPQPDPGLYVSSELPEAHTTICGGTTASRDFTDDSSA